MKIKTLLHSAAVPFSWEGFTFLGGNLERGVSLTAEEHVTPSEDFAFSLAQAKADHLFYVVGFKGNADTMQHLKHLGFYPGAAVQVISRSLSRSVVVTVSSKRLGLGQQLAQQVVVCES
ncbi:MAG TPA: ferrous iron transport protein A [Thermosynechococcaceae cyanobacterium]